ncbi:hypothetical protein FRC12_010214 [Ceratobasidium sp. 428]|nr:hypothetical protein FRC12_010214 [Ceratobasidium sp. 428]
MSSDTDSDVEILDTDSEVEIIETVTGSCPCCGFHGELEYVNQGNNADTRSPRKLKRRRSRSPGSQQFLKDLLAAIERPKTESETEPVKQLKPIKPAESQSFIQRFFNDFPEFEYDPSGETMSQFQNLSQSFNWKRGDHQLEDARQKLRIALTQDFNYNYGTDENDLNNWQSLCRVLQLPDIPDDLDVCRQVVKSTFVNLVDLVDTKNTKQPVKHFETERKLSEYTQRTRKFFPLSQAYAGGLLRFLLRDIYNPDSGRDHDGRPQPKRPRQDTR